MGINKRIVVFTEPNSGYLLSKLIFLFCLLGFSIPASALNEKLAIIGYNTSTPDSISFVAIEPFAAGEKIYFTDNEFVSTGTFNDAGEGTAFYTVPAGGLAAGSVVALEETGSSTNTFGVTCSFASGAACGSATVVDRSAEDPSANANVSYAGSDAIFAYRDTDDNPANGVTGVYAAISRDAFSTIVNNSSPLDWAGNPETPVVVEGFAGTVTHRDFKNALRTSTTVGQFISPANYDTGTTFQALDLTAISFSSGTNPELSITANPSSVAEDSGSDIVYSFTLTPAPTNPVTISFSVSGSATLTTDYTAASSATLTFSASAGSIIVPPSGTATLTVSSNADTTVEPFETVILSGVPSTGYDLGTTNTAVGTISNDDTDDSAPLVAISGLNHATPDGFSFVALTDISMGEVIYFTDRAFNNTSLVFSGTEGVVRWVAPTGVQRGDVIVASERLSPNTNSFDVTCSDGSGTAICGTIEMQNSTNFSISGEEFYAYSDSDTEPNNGVTQIHAALNTRGPVIPALEDPSTIYKRAVVISNFDSVFPGITTENRVEYKFASGERGSTIDLTAFSDINNWLYGATPQVLSTIAFADISIGQGPPIPKLSVAVSASGVVEDSGSSLTYTFTLDSPAAADQAVNFTISGTANTTDYSVSNVSPVTILNGQTETSITVTPTTDTTLEPDESVTVSIAAGVGYVAGTISSVTANIVNDDTGVSMPLVAIVGVNAINPDDGFSFVALEDIPAATEIYFTDRPFDRTSISFPGTGDGVYKWVAPAGVTRGEVFALKESATSNVIDTLFCSDGSGATCGVASLEAGTISLSTSEPVYAYADTDSQPNNGVTEVYSVTYPATGALGVIPDLQNPKIIFPEAIVADQLSITTSSLYEYDESKRSATVTKADLEDTARPTPGNWIVETASRALSVVKFDNIAFGNLANLSLSASTATEAGSTAITVTVTADAAVAGNQTVDLAVSGVGITAGDYTLSNTSITILDGQTTGTATFTVQNDALVEALTETANLTISNPSSGIQLGATVSDSIDITDNDSATLSISDVAITEGNSSAQLTVTLSAPVDIPVSLSAATADDSASAADNDYVAVASGSLTFTANSVANATQSFSVNILSDQKVELNEALLVNLSSIVAPNRDVTFADSQGMITINNDDSATLSISDVTLNEGDSANTSFDFTVTLSHSVDAAVSADASTIDGTASSANGDFTALSGSAVSFAANSSADATQVVSVDVVGDETVELDEAFRTVLSNLSAAGRNVTFANNEASAQITNDDNATISIADLSMNEGNAASTDFAFIITLDKTVDTAIDLTFSASDGSALLSDNDFTAASGSVNFTANSSPSATQSATVVVNADTKIEANETLMVNLADLNANGRSVTISDAQAVGTIINDDSATVTLTPVTAVRDEGNDPSGRTQFTFSATLDNAVQGGFDIEYTTNDGSATVADNDYVDNDASLSFSGTAGEEMVITVDVNHDNNIELDETFDVTLGNITNLGAGIDANALTASTAAITATISNDDIDTDIDGVLDRNDNCPNDANADQSDIDGDNIGDVCDNDTDGDNINDSTDNCPLIANADQVDLDQDGFGNLCDSDIDGDSMPNDYETANGLNPLSSFDQRADPDGDGFTNIQEFEFGTDPQVANTDADGNGIPDIIDRRNSVAPIIPAIIVPLLLED